MPTQPRSQVPGSSETASKFPPKNTPSHLITIAYRLIRAKFLDSLSDTRITPAQIHILRELMETGPQTQADLARELGVGKAAVAQTITRLLRDGYVQRSKTSADRRIIIISLTDKARGIEQELIAGSLQGLTMIEDVLGAKQSAQLQQLMRKLVGGLQSSIDSDHVEVV